MKTIFYLLLFYSTFSFAQVYEFVKTKENKIISHRIIIDKEYLIETQYVKEPAEFILTRGGYYKKKGKIYNIDLEFNSNFENDGLKIIDLKKEKSWSKSKNEPIDLNGKWLMAGRVTKEGERRRDITRPRKTMKFLKDGYFQWIAFNTETFQFFGTGGGFYTAEKGIYTENIEFFSRNNNSVGRKLPFSYEVKDSDWYHKGKSSKGKPMHEIWTRRSNLILRK